MFGLATFVGLPSCKAVNPPPQTEAEIKAAPSDDGLLDAKDLHRGILRFREVFLQLAEMRGFSKDEGERLLFLPKLEQLRPPAEALQATNNKDLLRALDEHLGKFTLSMVYEEGAHTASPLAGNLQAWFKDRGPVTFIVLPELYSEFPETAAAGSQPFPTVFGPQSRFRQAHQQKLAGLSDPVFDLSSGKEAAAPLLPRIELGSLDNELGAEGSKVQLIYLKPLWGSLESFDGIAASARRDLRRLDKIFSQLPPEATGSIYFLGLSRGALVGLELLAAAAQADPAAHPFMQRVHGLVSLGGPFYGSILIDEERGVLADLEVLEAKVGELSLAPGAGYKDKSGQVFLSAEAIVASVWGADRRVQEPDPYFARRYAQLWLRELLDKNAKLSAVQERERALRSSRTALQKLRGSLAELSPSARLNWWASHVVPPKLHYYATRGSFLPPPQAAQKLPEALSTSPYFGNLSAELKQSLFVHAEALRERGAGGISDGTLPPASTYFWPLFAQRFNPQQAGFAYHELGILGTHHWGLFRRDVWPPAGPEGTAPAKAFPDELLLEALAGYILSPKS